MKKAEKEMNQEELEKVRGGFLSETDFDSVTSHIIKLAHCKVCHKEMVCYNAMYRCPTAGCRECGMNKTVAEVDWY